MSPSLLDDLETAVGGLENTLEASRAGRRAHTGASAELRTIGHEVMVATEILEGLVRYRFGEDIELMGAWTSARNVFGPVRHRVPAESADGASGAGGEVAPAA